MFIGNSSFPTFRKAVVPGGRVVPPAKLSLPVTEVSVSRGWLTQGGEECSQVPSELITTGTVVVEFTADSLAKARAATQSSAADRLSLIFWADSETLLSLSAGIKPVSLASCARSRSFCASACACFTAVARALRKSGSAALVQAPKSGSCLTRSNAALPVCAEAEGEWLTVIAKSQTGTVSRRQARLRASRKRRVR